jgi:NTP pyrophosphatase (non-canonical NTP hydrolase)
MKTETTMTFEYEAHMPFPDPRYERDMWLLNSTPQNFLEEFITKFEQWDESDDLGMKLIAEEYAEVIKAYDDEPDEDLLKELADLVYVVHWYAVKRNWDLDEALRRVHESNMSKLPVDGKVVKDKNGKVLKSPSYYKPNLSDLVK